MKDLQGAIEALKRIRIYSSVAQESCTGKQSVRPTGSTSRVMREQQSLILFWSCACRICNQSYENTIIRLVVVASISLSLLFL